MTNETEAEIIKALRDDRESMSMRNLVKLLKFRREKHRDRLEESEDSEIRGRSLECKFLLGLFSGEE